MTELIITRGIPGSGKSTYAEAWVRAGKDRVRVNRDDIRKMCFGVDFGCDENFVSIVEENIVGQALSDGKSVIVDATHIKPSYVQRWKDRAQKFDAEFSVKEFLTPLEVCLDRNARRDRYVPQNVIRQMHEALEAAGSLA